MTWRLFKYARCLTRKRFLTSKLYKSANADIVVDSSRHTAKATARNIAHPLGPLNFCRRCDGAIIFQNRTDWCIRMQRMSSTCCCIHMLLHVAKCIFKQIFTKFQSLGICIEHRNPLSNFTSHGVCTMFTIEKQSFIHAPRHWQALFK